MNLVPLKTGGATTVLMLNGYAGAVYHSLTGVPSFDNFTLDLWEAAPQLL